MSTLHVKILKLEMHILFKIIRIQIYTLKIYRIINIVRIVKLIINNQIQHKI